MPRVLLLRTQYTLYQTSNAKTLAPLTVKMWVNNKDSPHTIKYHPKQYSFILLGGNL